MNASPLLLTLGERGIAEVGGRLVVPPSPLSPSSSSSFIRAAAEALRAQGRGGGEREKRRRRERGVSSLPVLSPEVTSDTDGGESASVPSPLRTTLICCSNTERSLAGFSPILERKERAQQLRHVDSQIAERGGVIYIRVFLHRVWERKNTIIHRVREILEQVLC